MNCMLTSGRQVVGEIREDNGEMFGNKMWRLVAELCEQQTNAAKLDHAAAVILEELECGR